MVPNVPQAKRTESAELPGADRPRDRKVSESAKDMFAQQYVELLWKQCSAKRLAERRKKRADELRQ
jgi:hypothetical protein